MRRPGYLGTLNEFWGVRKTRRSQLGNIQILQQLGYLGDDEKEAEKRRKEAEKRRKEAEKRRKEAEKRERERIEAAQERELERREAAQERELERREEARERQEEAREQGMMYRHGVPAVSAPAPVSPVAVPVAAPVAAPVAEVSPSTVLPTTVAKSPAVPPVGTLMPPPIMIAPQVRPLPAQRYQVSAQKAAPAPAPLVTPQMARLGKIAAAIGAGMFLL